MRYCRMVFVSCMSLRCSHQTIAVAFVHAVRPSRHGLNACIPQIRPSPAVSQDMHCITSYIDVSAVPGDNDKTADAVDRCGILSAYRRRRHMQLSTGYDGAALGLLELASEAERS